MNVNYLSYISEYFGTFFFILVILASAGNPVIVGAALALGILLVGKLSGAYFNPAVTLSMYMYGTISAMNMFIYVFLQLLGGFSAYYAYRILN